MIAKKEMFMAFAVGHMIELLLTCGLILTEDTFSALVGSKVNDRNIMLLKTGILIRHAMRGVKLDKFSYMNNTTPPKKHVLISMCRNIEFQYNDHWNYFVSTL